MKRALILVIVACGAIAAAQEQPDRSKPPALAPPKPLTLPAIQKRSLSNQIAVWAVEAHEVPIVQVSLVIRAGASNDPAGKFGTATLAAAMLDEGAGSRSALQIADAIEFLGATLTTGSGFDASAVRLNAPGERLDEALAVMADVARRPTFSDKELERLRQERLTTLLQARADPSSIAGVAFSRAVFGRTHRYGTGTLGTHTSVKTLSATDLRSFYSTHYQPANVTIVVVGDITIDAALPTLEKYFGGWARVAAPASPFHVPSAPQVTGRQIYLVDKPEAEQSQIRIGWVGVPRSTPDYFPLLVLNTVLGGSFTSRLNQNLREEHGYAYGASSVFDMRLSPGPFVAAAGVQSDKTADALREFFKELNGVNAPIGMDELARAKNYIALGFPAEFETTTDLSRQLEEMIIYRLPDNYFERYVPNIMAVTAARVRAAAVNYMQPARAAVVVVGDRKTIEPGIRALNLGPIQVISVDEVFE